MATNSLLKQYSDERTTLAQSALPKAAAIILGRRRVLSGIRWRDDLIVTAAEAIGGAEHVDVQLESGELEAEVIATDLTTDVAVLRVGAASDEPGAAGAESAPSAGARLASSPGAGASSSQRSPAGSVVGGTSAQDASSRNAESAQSGAAAPGAGADSSPSASAGAAAGGGTSAQDTAVRVVSAPLLRVGETILVVGRTLRGPAAIWGNVQLAGPAWKSRRGGKIDQRLELDVGFDTSFEGAAVIDMSGNIVAMAVPGPYYRVLGIPATTIDTVVSKVHEFGHLPKPYIGIRLQPLWLDEETRNKLGRKSRGIAAVGGVDAGSPAADAHIELGDLLLTLDGEPAESVNGLVQRIAGMSPGQTISLEVLRGGQPLTISVQIGERPRR